MALKKFIHRVKNESVCVYKQALKNKKKYRMLGIAGFSLKLFTLKR